MRPVKLIADSSCDIGPELAKRYNVDFVHIHVRLNGQEYLDGVDITHREIYENYEKNHTLPSTAAMNIDEYAAIFRPYIEQGYDIVHVSLGSGLSSTCNNAHLAGELFDAGRVYVIDSKSLSTGSGHIVCECGERINKGMEAEQVAREVQPIADRVSASFILDDLEYLHAGGRCSGLAQFGASLMNLKPCIMVRPELFGSMTVGKKYMGSYKRSALTRSSCSRSVKSSSRRQARQSARTAVRIQPVFCSFKNDHSTSVHSAVCDLRNPDFGGRIS